MGKIQRVGTNDRLSRSVSYNGLVFLSGQTSDDRSLDFAGQLANLLTKVDAALAEAGTDKSRILSTQVWMKDIEKDFASLNEIWSGWLPSGCAPTRATAQCVMGLPDILVEVIVMAAVH